MKRVATIAAVVLATTVGVSAAEAAISKGTFAGKTSKGDPVGLKVDKKHRVVSFYYEGVTLSCTDGDSITTPTGKDRVITPTSVKFKINAARKWGIHAKNDDTGFGWDADARFNASGSKTTGTLSIFATFNDQNEQDPNGSVRCESGDLKFSLKRK